jgi:catechol 2,3-dioxygenase-like lactoylglutathione lyase family enzyme
MVAIGENAKMSALPSERDRIRRFYHDILGCEVIEKPSLDLIRLGSDFFIGVVYSDSALSDQQALESVWLELKADDPEALKQKIVAFGVKQIQHWDKEHFYFQAPGGQAYRIVGKHEDLSKWQH